MSNNNKISPDKESQEEEYETLTLKAEKQEQEENEPQRRIKHAVVLTGGIDSTVMLYDLKKSLADNEVEIVPIMAGDKEYIDPTLYKLKIKSSPLVKVQLPSDLVNATNNEEWEKFFEKLAQDHISMVHFADNYEEALHYNNKNSASRNRLISIAANYGIQVSMPLQTNTKQSIIQRGVDEYSIDLEKLAPPADKNDPIRKEAFSNIYSQRLAKRIDDPFSDKPRIAKQEEGG